MSEIHLHGPAVGYPLGGRVDALVARWGTLTPDATALVRDGEEVGYGELCARAEAQRRALAGQGVGPGDVVAVRLPRGPHLVAVLLGVLATGAAYAGGATEWPRERFDAIVRTCRARAVIDEDTPPVPPADGPLRTAPGGPLDPCCVFSTSGSSSGRPRGVLTPHAGTVRIALDPLLGLDATTRMWQISPLGWDAMSMELWGPLVHGGVSVLHPGSHPGPRDLRAAVADGVTTTFLTTSLFNALVEEDVDAFRGLSCVMTGGERISPPHVRLLRDAHPGLRIVNGYGPVECSVFVTAHAVAATGDVDDVPIGTPVANTGITVRDGEILVSGDGVGLEYLGEPEATAERFRVDPDGVRRYRTGDRGSVGPDGVLTFCGRADRQFKIRGTRIAPEEVEAAMDALPGVLRSVLLPVEGPSGPETLACLVGTPGPDTVRAHLAARFPSAVVPRTVLCLDGLPTTPNGKLDTAALVALARTPAPSGEVAAGRSDPATDRVVAAAADLLATPVGPDTDLFAAGANSITVIKLASRLGLDAAAVVRGRTPRAVAAAPAPVRGGVGRGDRWVAGLPLTQYRMWWLESHHPGAADMVNPLLFRVRGPLDTARLAAAVRAVAVRHEALHTRLRPRSRRWIDAVAVPDEPVACAVVPHDEEAVRTFLTAPFDLTRDAPLRARVFRVADGEHVVALAVHHVAYDGWSEAVLCRDLSAAYAGAVLGPAPGFRAVADAQAERAPAVDRFWFDHLAGVPEIPLLGPGAAAGGAGPVREHRIALDGDDVERAAARYGVTATAVRLAGWVAALRAETGAADFAVGMPVGGRTVAEADDVVGCFASSAVLRFPAGVRTPADCVRHGAALLARLLADPHVPLERINVEQPPSPRGRHPLCQVGFVVQNTDRAELRLAGTEVERVAVPRAASLFELALEIHEGEAVVWHRTDLVPAARAARLAAGWASAVRGIADAGTVVSR